jgi:Asp-tRNA(Asn)/Glu-tRNA(Gln) amidotransferase B subunit
LILINKLTDQYKSGNEKALNALMGKFLKSNKGYDPKEVKEELIKILGG